jgi:ribose-phosphate pyrophosphokinase
MRGLKFETKVFPDGESYVRIPDLPGAERVFVMNSLYPNQDKRIIETLLVCEALREANVDNVTLVLPYLAYARQDRIFLKGEPVSAKAIGSAFRYAGVTKAYVVEAHSDEAIRAFGGDVSNISVDESLIAAIKSLIRTPDLIVAPDEKASKRVKIIADAIGAESVYFSKRRDRITGEVSSELNTSIELTGKRAVIVDDIISTGGSVATASRTLLEKGVHSVRALCIHALMVQGAEELLAKNGVQEIYGSNTIDTNFTRYSVASEVSNALEKLLK